MQILSYVHIHVHNVMETETELLNKLLIVVNFLSIYLSIRSHLCHVRYIHYSMLKLSMYRNVMSEEHLISMTRWVNSLMQKGDVLSFRIRIRTLFLD